MTGVPCAAQAQADIASTVTDPAGEPIALAQVTAKTDAETYELYTDEQGQFALDPAWWANGATVVLTITSVDYADLVVTLASPPTAGQPFQMSPQQTDGAEIVVTARRISRPFSPKTLGFLDIATNASAKGDPLQAVNTLPVSTNVLGNARLTLRGNRTAINRTYLNYTPVYEFATGSEFDNTTQGRSIFNLAVGNDVEVYPVNPPSYLAGASGGAVRLITPSSAEKLGIVSLSTVGVSAVRTLANESGSDFLTVFAGATDLSLHTAINPDLKSLIGRVRSLSGGALAGKAFDDGSELSGFFHAETSSDAFPFAIGASRTTYGLEPSKVRGIVNLTRPVGEWALTASLAYTYSHTTERFANWAASGINQYGFGSIDIVGQPFGDDLTLRLGVDGELIKQDNTNNSGQFGAFTAPAGTVRLQINRLDTASVFSFATYHVSPNLDLSAGARKIFASNQPSDVTLQASAAITSGDRRHKLILSVGQYSGFAVPTQAYFGPIAASKSRQIEANYSFNLDTIRFGVAGYIAEESSAGATYDPAVNIIFNDNLTNIARTTKTEGLEFYINASFLDRFKADFSYTLVHQRIRLGDLQVRGSNDFPTILRANIGYVAPRKTSVDFSLVWRTGEPYTEVVGLAGGNNLLVPTYGPVNGSRRPDYFSVDASASREIDLFNLKNSPLLFLSVSNIFDRRNASSQLLTTPFERGRFRELPGRVITLGLVFNF